MYIYIYIYICQCRAVHSDPLSAPGGEGIYISLSLYYIYIYIVYIVYIYIYIYIYIKNTPWLARYFLFPCGRRKSGNSCSKKGNTWAPQRLNGDLRSPRRDGVPRRTNPVRLVPRRCHSCDSTGRAPPGSMRRGGGCAAQDAHSSKPGEKTPVN